MAVAVLTVIENGAETGRNCLTCKKIKPYSEFQKDIHGYMQKKARCRDCCNKTARERDYPNNKRSGMKNRPDKMKKYYGIDYDTVLRTFEHQHGLCANRGCGKEISLEVTGGKTRAMIDHSHKTGKFRALLCMMCNLTLGKIEADKNNILGLMEYLDKHNN